MVAVPGAITDPSQVRSAEITVDVGDASLRAHLARPAQGGTRPGIVVIHEAFGLNDHIRDVADRFANAGFDAIAPDLYTREGTPDTEHVGAVLFGLRDEQAVADLAACAAHVRSLDGASGKIGAIGFCSGGRHTLLFAARSGALDAAVPCWGGYIDRATADEITTASRPERVVDMLDGVRCPVYLVGGAEDANPSPDLLRDVRDKLAARGVDVQLDIFDNAGHAFFADYRPNYREEAAHALWPRVVAFFERTLR